MKRKPTEGVVQQGDLDGEIVQTARALVRKLRALIEINPVRAIQGSFCRKEKLL